MSDGPGRTDRDRHGAGVRPGGVREPDQGHLQTSPSILLPGAPYRQRESELPTAPIPARSTATASRSRNVEPGPPYRRLVPEPRPRWYRRSASRPYAARGVRPRYVHQPLPLLPEWLRSQSPRRPTPRPHTPRGVGRAHPHDTQPPLPSLPQWLPPYSPACPPSPPSPAPAPVAAPAPSPAPAPITAP